MARKSEEQIKAVFIECLKEKPFEQITVKEVCIGAGLNRSTFYEDFGSLYDLLCEVQRDYFRGMFDLLSPKIAAGVRMSRDEAYATTLAALKYHMEHREYFFALLASNSTGEFETNIACFLKKEILPAGYTKLDEYEFIYNFMGNIITVISWLNDGCPITPEALARLLTRSIPHA